MAAQAIAEANAEEAARQENIARIGELAAQSIAMQKKDSKISILLAIESFRLGGTVQSRGALLDAAKVDTALQKYCVGHSEPVLSVAFHPDGKIFASGSEDDTIILWDVKTCQPIGQPLREHTGNVFSVAFSPDGKTLASGSWDINLVLWNLKSDPPSHQPLPGYSDSVQSVAFNPDGETLALGNVGNAILLWDMETREPIGQPLSGHSRPVRSVAFSPDGKTLVSGSDDHTVILWDLNPQSWLEKACQHAGRNFTRTEWTLCFPNDPYPVEKEDATCPQWPLEPEVMLVP